MKQEPKTKALSGGSKSGPQPPALADLRAIRLSQRATNQRVELKLWVFRLTEQHMDQAVSLIRRWLKDEQP